MWVFGGIERELKKCFLEVVEDRSVNILIFIIKKFVEFGIIILLDCWKVYFLLKFEGY